MTQRRGLSLVEVLVAVALVALVAQGAAAVLLQSLRWQHRARTRLEQLDDVRMVLAAHEVLPCTDRPAPPPLLHPIEVGRAEQWPVQSLWVRSGDGADTMRFTLLRRCP